MPPRDKLFEYIVDFANKKNGVKLNHILQKIQIVKTTQLSVMILNKGLCYRWGKSTWGGLGRWSSPTLAVDGCCYWLFVRKMDLIVVVLMQKSKTSRNTKFRICASGHLVLLIQASGLLRGHCQSVAHFGNIWWKSRGPQEAIIA